MSPTGSSADPTSGLTGFLARSMLGYRFGDLPEVVRTVAKHCVLDWLGVTIAGSQEPVATILREEVAADLVARGCTLIGAASRASGADAALVNGTAGHALDFDDVLASMSGHPSVPVMPAAFALAERLDVDGEALLAAVVAGIETEARLGLAVSPGHYDAGFHATGTLGAFGAAAAAASLLGLDADQTSVAFGIAGTQAAGLKSQFGTMCKPLHAGRAAAGGLLAASLAARGFTGVPDIVQCDQGFAATHTSSFDPAAGMDPVGRPWRIRDVLFKFHAACYFTHASIEALVAIRQRARPRPSDIGTVTLRVPPGHLAVCNIPSPTTPLEGKFSLRFTSALALVRGEASEQEFTADSVHDPELTAVRDRVHVEPVADMPRFASQVEVELVDGRRLTHEVDMERPADDHELAAQEERLAAKFSSLVGPVLGPERADKIADIAGLIEHVGSVRELTALCRLPDQSSRPDGASTTQARR